MLSLDSLSAESLLALGGFSQLVTVYIAGFITSLTPCVYPLIPITLATFGANQDESKIRSFFLALTYVLGISTTYTSLGIISAKTGAIFGAFLGSIYTQIGIAVVILLLALVMLELLGTTLLSKIQTKANSLGGRAGFIGTFIAGLVSGVVAAPCVGPVLAVILLVAASSQSTVWGGTLLFVYSLGVGTIFLILGTFSGLINKLPRSGNWLNFVKFIIATALIGVGLFFTQSLIPTSPWSIIHQLGVHQLGVAIITLITVILLLLARISYTKDIKLLRGLSALALGTILFFAVIPPPKMIDLNSELWTPNYVEALSKGESSNRIVMIDLYADWCAACKELDEITFAAPESEEVLSQVITSRVEYSDAEELIEKYEVLGLPSVLFIDPKGEEIPKTRITGFIPPEEFIARMQKILK